MIQFVHKERNCNIMSSWIPCTRRGFFNMMSKQMLWSSLCARTAKERKINMVRMCTSTGGLTWCSAGCCDAFLCTRRRKFNMLNWMPWWKWCARWGRLTGAQLKAWIQCVHTEWSWPGCSTCWTLYVDSIGVEPEQVCTGVSPDVHPDVLIPIQFG